MIKTQNGFKVLQNLKIMIPLNTQWLTVLDVVNCRDHNLFPRYVLFLTFPFSQVKVFFDVFISFVPFVKD